MCVYDKPFNPLSAHRHSHELGTFRYPLGSNPCVQIYILSFSKLTVATAVIYFAAFPKDRARWKFLVCVVTCLELIETTAGTRDVVRTLGAGWGDMDALDDVGWAWFSVPIMGSASECCSPFFSLAGNAFEAPVACIGQSFFAWRIYIIGHNIYISGLIMTVCLSELQPSRIHLISLSFQQLSTVQLGGGIWTGVNICNARKFSVLQTHNLRATSVRPVPSTLVSSIYLFCHVGSDLARGDGPLRPRHRV